MWSSNAFLKRCEKLKELGLSPDPQTGTRVARGFADLGYEEFYCLNGTKLVSIFTGHPSELSQEHRKFFFSIPSIEGMVDAIAKRGFDVERSEFVNQRSWKFSIRHAESGELIETSDAELCCAVADALIQTAGANA